MQRLIFLALPLLAGGCDAMRADAPSLLPRPIESRSAAEVVAQVNVAPDLAFDARVAAAVSAFDVTAKEFAALLATVEPRVARAGDAAAGSDAWIDAQAALGEIGSARGTSDAALADLEALAIERGSAGLPPLPALDTAIASANARIASQNDAVTRLQAIPRPL